MKQRRTDEELDTLLDRGGLGACRRDSILEDVIEQVGRERSARMRWRWPVVGLAGAVLTSVVLLLTIPNQAWHSGGGAAFRAKGVETGRRTQSHVSVAIECSQGTLAACPRGSLLLVRVAGARGAVAAWAEPLGGGERIWYFSAETSSPVVDGISDHAALASRAIKIGPEHKAGTYVVEIRVTDRPMGRDEVLRLPPSAALASGQAVLMVTSS